MIHRVLAMAIAAAVLLLASNLQQAKAEKKESYAACKAKLSKVPPCNSNWTRACAAQCGSKF